MVRSATAGFVLALALALAPAICHAVTPNPDTIDSKALSAYLHNNLLPLVEGRIVKTDGDKSLILYGYVATDFGKHDAERQARYFLDDREIPITNRIVVRPELLTIGLSQPAAPASPADRSEVPAGEDAASVMADTDAALAEAEHPADLEQSDADREAYARQEQDDELLAGQTAALATPLAPIMVGPAVIGPVFANTPWMPFQNPYLFPYATTTLYVFPGRPGLYGPPRISPFTGVPLGGVPFYHPFPTARFGGFPRVGISGPFIAPPMVLRPGVPVMGLTASRPMMGFHPAGSFGGGLGGGFHPGFSGGFGGFHGGFGGGFGGFHGGGHR